MTWVFLDSDPVGLACHKLQNPDAIDLRIWMAGQKGSARLVIPEIIDYEVRRSLLKDEEQGGIARLDNLYANGTVERLPLRTPALLRAAAIWADARRRHQPTADERSIDADVILVGQVLTFVADSPDWIILTENVAHLSRYIGDRAQSRRRVVTDYLRSPTSLVGD